MTWNKSAKRDRWGQRKQRPRPAEEWISVARPELQIVSDPLWKAAHDRLAAAKAAYLTATAGASFGRPVSGHPSRYLLTTLATCGVCGGGLRVCTRPSGRTVQKFYGCAAHHDRGLGVCKNRYDVPMSEADGFVIDLLLHHVINPA